MTSALARKFAVDVATYIPGLLPTDPSIIWTRFKGMTDFDPKISGTMESVDDYDSDGWTDSEKTMQSGTITIKARRPFDGGVYDPGQEIVRRAQIQFGDQARVFSRYYDRNLGPEARAGRFLVDWSQSKTAVTNVEEVTAVLTNSGKVFDIVNPAAAAVLPSIASISPAGKGAGQSVAIFGAGFSGATSVRFGVTVTNGVVTDATGTAATDWTIVSDQQIIAVLPAGSAGSTAVAVKNAAGNSNGYAYTRAV